MIRMILGNIGGGKTYHAVSQFLIPSLCDPDIKMIVTNIGGLDKFRLSALHGHKEHFCIDKLKIIDDTDVKLFWTLGLDKQTMFIIDEIQNFYGSSNYKENTDTREDLKKFLTKCRHQGHSCIFITQVPTMVHQDILKLTEEFITCIKLNFIKFLPSTKYTFLHRNTYKQDAKAVLHQGVGTYKPEIYLCYQSVDPGAKETSTKRKGFIPIKPLVALGALCLIFFGMKIYNWYKFPHPDKSSVTSAATKNKTGDIAHDTLYVNGWISDGQRITWCQGAQPVATSPDTGVRFGVHRVDGGGYVSVRPVDLYRASVSGFAANVGSADSGAAD